MKKPISIALKLSFALGIIQIVEYSIPDVHLVSAVQLIKVATMFLLLGHSLPKETTNQ